MKHTLIIPAIVFFLLSQALTHDVFRIDQASQRGSQNSVRIAIVGFVGPGADDAVRIETALTETLNRDNRVALIDQSLVSAAVAGVRYDRSINMSKDQARRLGAAIGCDFFIIGKTEALTRSTLENESHEEAYVAVMIVDAKTGSLAAFDLVSEKGATREAALKALAKSMSLGASSYVDRIDSFINSHAVPVSSPVPAKDSRSNSEKGIEDIPEEGSQRATGFTAPQFLNRIKPDYTSAAEAADVTATVEAMVVLHSNGTVGSIEIIRWAGFGLDESAERAIRQLKFKPATRDGKPVSVRPLIRYNFRSVR
jgi:TonB family protein